MSNQQENVINYRAYLNPPNHPSTGDIVCYCGDSVYDKDGEGKDGNTFVSISDCHCKARLHILSVSEQDKLDFLFKLETLISTVQMFKTDLEKRWFK